MIDSLQGGVSIELSYTIDSVQVSSMSDFFQTAEVMMANNTFSVLFDVNPTQNASWMAQVTVSNYTSVVYRMTVLRGSDNYTY